MVHEGKDSTIQKTELLVRGILTPDSSVLDGIEVSVASLADCLRYFGELFRSTHNENPSVDHDDFQPTDVMSVEPNGFDNLGHHQLN